MLDNMFNPIDLSDSANNVVKNLTNESTKNIGKTFGDLWYIVFGGITAYADKKRLKIAKDVDDFKIKLEDETAKIPRLWTLFQLLFLYLH